jgi:serine/threonine-protein kinase
VSDDESGATLTLPLQPKAVAVARDSTPTAENPEEPPTVVDPEEPSTALWDEPAPDGPAERPEDAAPFAARYETVETLGEGGMGRVLLCKDRLIGRLVAVKVLRDARGAVPEMRRRFLREARIQGQLEHPAIVPVYDMSASEEHSFFTMKRVHGRTLSRVLALLKQGDADTARGFGRFKLLLVFHAVCQAVAFAHERGVIHRDLKPSNVILGDYGQVSVIDWGLAKQLGDAGPEPSRADEPRTMTGKILGTPGYMAPEQARGEKESLGPPADVYSLGAILFELLTLSPLHPRGGLEEMVVSLLTGVDARPNQRAPGCNVPPELEAMCVKATEPDPARRYPSAKELLAALEQFLEGDRDMAVRQAAAGRHVQAARAALQGGPGREQREHALRQIGAALALAPGHEEATALLLSLLTAGPESLPKEAEAQLREFQRTRDRQAHRGLIFGYAGWAAFAPVILFAGRHQIGAAIFVVAPMMVAAALGVRMLRRPELPQMTFGMYLLGSMSVAATTTLAGWAIVVPALAAVHTIIFVMVGPQARRFHGIAVGALAILVPFLLQELHVIPSNYSFLGDHFEVRPVAMKFAPGESRFYLLLAALACVVVPGMVLAWFRRGMDRTELNTFLYAWNVQHLAPEEARRAAWTLSEGAREAPPIVPPARDE